LGEEPVEDDVVEHPLGAVARSLAVERQVPLQLQSPPIREEVCHELEVVQAAAHRDQPASSAVDLAQDGGEGGEAGEVQRLGIQGQVELGATAPPGEGAAAVDQGFVAVESAIGESGVQ